VFERVKVGARSSRSGLRFTLSPALETCRADARLLDDLRAAVPDTTNDLG
jgi:hypothetical protein